MLLVAVGTAVTRWQPTLCADDQDGSPLSPRSTQPLPPAPDTAHDPAPHGAAGARLTPALSSLLSSARRRILGPAPRHPCPTKLLDVAAESATDLARWGLGGVPSTVRPRRMIGVCLMRCRDRVRAQAVDDLAGVVPPDHRVLRVTMAAADMPADHAKSRWRHARAHWHDSVYTMHGSRTR